MGLFSTDYAYILYKARIEGKLEDIAICGLRGTTMYVLGLTDSDNIKKIIKSDDKLLNKLDLVEVDLFDYTDIDTSDKYYITKHVAGKI